jgi:hypothetical protein
MITSIDQAKLISRYVHRLEQLINSHEIMDGQTKRYSNEAFLIILHLEELIGRSNTGEVLCSECFITHSTHTIKTFIGWFDFIKPFVYNTLLSGPFPCLG